MTKEIVTIQVGTAANYVGAHFWNLQDEYLATPVQQREFSPAALFSEISPTNQAYRSGLRYAPRLQIVDSTGAFGALSTQAGVILPESPGKPTASAWTGTSQIFEQDPVARSKYIRKIHAEEAHANETSTDEASGPTSSPPLDDIMYWTDYFKVRLNPRTCFQMNGVHHQVTNLEYFETGSDLVSPILDDLYDNLRRFVEDCDSFGGLNVITNADDAFSGVSAAYLDHIAEELGSSVPAIVFGMHSTTRTYSREVADSLGAQYFPTKEVKFSTNEAQLVTKCMDYSIEYVPLAVPSAFLSPNLRLKNRDVFQASAILGLALDVALVPLRQRMSLSGLLGSIQPLPLATLGNIGCILPPTRSWSSFDQSLFQTNETMNLSTLLAGSRSSLSKRASSGNIRQKSYECVTARGLYHRLPINFQTSQPVTLPIPFPPIFCPPTRPDDGDTASSLDGNKEGILPDHISVMAAVGTVPDVGHNILMSLAEDMQKSILGKTQGQDRGELEELKETVISRAENYGRL